MLSSTLIFVAFWIFSGVTIKLKWQRRKERKAQKKKLLNRQCEGHSDIADAVACDSCRSGKCECAGCKRQRQPQRIESVYQHKSWFARTFGLYGNSVYEQVLCFCGLNQVKGPEHKPECKWHVAMPEVVQVDATKITAGPILAPGLGHIPTGTITETTIPAGSVTRLRTPPEMSEAELDDYIDRLAGVQPNTFGLGGILNGPIVEGKPLPGSFQTEIERQHDHDDVVEQWKCSECPAPTMCASGCNVSATPSSLHKEDCPFFTKAPRCACNAARLTGSYHAPSCEYNPGYFEYRERMNNVIPAFPSSEVTEAIKLSNLRVKAQQEQYKLYVKGEAAHPLHNTIFVDKVSQLPFGSGISQGTRAIVGHKKHYVLNNGIWTQEHIHVPESWYKISA